FSSRRRHTRFSRDWSSDVCSSDLLVCQCAADPLEEERPDTMLEHAPVPDVQDVVEVVLVGRTSLDELVAALQAGIGAEAEVAESPGELGYRLCGHVAVGLPADVRRAQVLLSREQCDLRLAVDVHASAPGSGSREARARRAGRTSRARRAADRRGHSGAGSYVQLRTWGGEAPRGLI